MRSQANGGEGHFRKNVGAKKIHLVSKKKRTKQSSLGKKVIAQL